MKKYLTVPLTLYRIQPRLPVSLRAYDIQMAKGRTSFDLKRHNGLVLPISPDTHFHTPNGMSLRPAGENMTRILQNFKGEPSIFTLVCGLRLPDGFCIYHEHTDHYSLQTTEQIELGAFNAKLTEFLKSLPFQTRAQFMEQQEDIDDQDNWAYTFDVPW